LFNIKRNIWMSWLKIDRVLSRLQTASDCNEKSSTCRPSCQPQNTKILNSECDRNVYNTGISTIVVPATVPGHVFTRYVDQILSPRLSGPVRILAWYVFQHGF